MPVVSAVVVSVAVSSSKVTVPVGRSNDTSTGEETIALKSVVEPNGVGSCREMAPTVVAALATTWVRFADVDVAWVVSPA